MKIVSVFLAESQTYFQVVLVSIRIIHNVTDSVCNFNGQIINIEPEGWVPLLGILELLLWSFTDNSVLLPLTMIFKIPGAVHSTNESCCLKYLGVLFRSEANMKCEIDKWTGDVSAVMWVV